MPDLHPIPTTMKMPSDRRPHIWRQGVLQIWVTRQCDKSCCGCTQGSNLTGPFAKITPEQFEKACDSLKDYWGVVGVFGGNPCLHPDFEVLCEILRAKIPFEQRGLWSNKLFGHGATCRTTFNPAVSNLNVHLDQEARQEMIRDWPESAHVVKGHDSDSRHSPPYVALQDVEPDEAERWRLIGACDVNQNWSSMICVVKGELRGFFCELAGAQAMLHEREPDYPDTGLIVEPGWWKKGVAAFEQQIRFHCMACGIPLRGAGDFAVDGKVEQVSKTHQGVYRLKLRGREVQLVTDRAVLGLTPRATDYIENATRQMIAEPERR